jgi:alpha-ribazole phosphatase
MPMSQGKCSDSGVSGITYIDLLRHGEVEGGVRFRGSNDHPLTAEGWAQMWAAVGTDIHWDRIVTSPLARCADFARALSRYRSIPLEINENLRELHFGAWEGRTVAELMAEHTEALTRFWQDPLNHPPPDAEPLTQLQSRTLTVWNSVLARYPREHILLITHGGPIRILLCHLLEKPLDRLPEIDVTHAGLYRICVRTDTGGSIQKQLFEFTRLRP